MSNKLSHDMKNKEVCYSIFNDKVYINNTYYSKVKLTHNSTDNVKYAISNETKDVVTGVTFNANLSFNEIYKFKFNEEVLDIHLFNTTYQEYFPLDDKFVTSEKHFLYVLTKKYIYQFNMDIIEDKRSDGIYEVEVEENEHGYSKCFTHNIEDLSSFSKILRKDNHVYIFTHNQIIQFNEKITDKSFVLNLPFSEQEGVNVTITEDYKLIIEKVRKGEDLYTHTLEQTILTIY